MIKSRTAFMGFHTKPEVKEALRDHCETANTTMSQFIDEAVKEKMESEGIEIKPSKLPGEPLPFEDAVGKE